LKVRVKWLRKDGVILVGERAEIVEGDVRRDARMWASCEYVLGCRR
jgi:hypothetical protein